MGRNLFKSTKRNENENEISTAATTLTKPNWPWLLKRNKNEKNGRYFTYRTTTPTVRNVSFEK